MLRSEKLDMTMRPGGREIERVVTQAPGTLEFLPLDDLRRQLEVNLIGQLAVTQAFLPLLRQGQGRIVNWTIEGGAPNVLYREGWKPTTLKVNDQVTVTVALAKDGSNQGNAADLALIYAGLDEKDQAFTWLQKAYEDRFNPSILSRPAFDTLRSDRRFQDLLRRLGLNR